MIARVLLAGALLAPLSIHAGEIRVRLRKNVSANDVHLDGFHWRLRFIPRGKKVDVIAYIPIEEYIAGVIPNEMPSNWPLEALKAQAVAARSFAYHRMALRRGLDFDVEADVLDQRFGWDDVSPRIRRIVGLTHGLVLRRSDSRVLEALYHADCGGVTESARNVWGGANLFASHPDCPHPSRHWNADLERRSLIDKFITFFGLPAGTGLRTVQAVGRDAAGRVKEVRIDFDGAGVRSLSSQEFRQLLGYQRVRSSNFQMTWQGKQLHISGLGEGHGVGLCQRGARALAEQGRKFDEILKFYYPGAKLKDLVAAE